MISLRAHFDGKVIVPDEPVELPADRELLIDVRYKETTVEFAHRVALDHEFDIANIGIDEFLEDVAAARTANARRIVDTPDDGLGWPFLRATVG
jgi:hypothetical protein